MVIKECGLVKCLVFVHIISYISNSIVEHNIKVDLKEIGCKCVK
jgi:hypothetical protein